MKQRLLAACIFVSCAVWSWGQTTTTWNGSTDTSWNTPGNWDTNAVPASGDDVIIIDTSGTGMYSPEINADVSIGALTIAAGAVLTKTGGNLDVTGSVTVNGTFDLSDPGNASATHTFSRDVDIQTGGSLYIGANSISVAGNFTDAGTFTCDAASTITLSGTSKTISVSGSGALGNVTVTGTYTAGSGFDIGGALEVNSGGSLDIGAYSISVAGNFTDAGTFTCGGSSTITLSGTGKTISVSGSDTLGNVTVTGTYTAGSGFNIGRALAVNSGGSLDIGAFSISVAGDTVIDGTLQIPVGGAFVAGGNFTSAGTLTCDAASTITLSGTGAISVSGSGALGNVTVTGSYTAGSGFTISGALAVDSGGSLDIGAYSISVTGDTVIDGTLQIPVGGAFVAGGNFTSTSTGTLTCDAASPITLSGTGKTISIDGSGILGNVTVTGSYTVVSGSLHIGGALAVDSGGSLDTGANNIWVTGDTVIDGTLEIPGGGPFKEEGDFIIAGTLTCSATSTITLSGTGKTISVSGSATLGNVTVSGTYTAGSGFDISGALTIITNTGVFDIQTHDVNLTGTFSNYGTLKISGTQTLGINFNSPIGFTDGTVEFSGNGELAGITAFYNLIINNGQRTAGDATTIYGGLVIYGRLTAGNSFDIDGTLTINSGGVFDIQTYVVTLAGPGMFSNNGTLKISGSQTLGTLGTYFNSTSGTSGTVEFSGNGGLAGITDFYNLIINNGQRTAGDATTIYGTLTINSGGVFDIRTYDVTLAGPGMFSNNGTLKISWSQTLGTNFNSTSGRVEFSGNGELAGITTFYDLQIQTGNRTIPSPIEVMHDFLIGTAAGNFTLQNNAAATVGGKFEYTGAGAVYLGGNISASGVGSAGGISIAGTVTLTEDVTLNTSAGGGAITVGTVQTDGSPRALTLNAGSASTGDISVNGNIGTASAPLGDIQITNGGNLVITGAVASSGKFAQSGGGPVRLGGNISASGAGGISIAGAVTLMADVTLDTGAGSGAITVRTVQTDGSPRALTLDTGSAIAGGNISVNGNIGTASDPLGDIQITNHGNLVITGAVASSGKFAQSGGGPVYLGGNISASGADGISIAGAVTLTEDVRLNTSAGGGAITVGTVQTDGSPRALTLDTGSAITGDVSVNGPVGSVNNPLGTVTIDSAGIISFENTVAAAGYTQTGTGSTVIASTGLMVIGGEIRAQGAVTNEGVITANRAVFSGDYNGAGGALNGNGIPDAGFEFRGAVVELGDFTPYNNRVTLTGSSNQTLGINPGFTVGGVLINTPGNTVTITGDIRQSDGALVIAAGELNLNGRCWYAGTDAPPSGAKGFYGIQGSLTLGDNSALQPALLSSGGASPGDPDNGGVFTTASTFSVTVLSRSAVTVSGHASLEGTYRFSGPASMTSPGNVRVAWNTEQSGEPNRDMDQASIIMTGNGVSLSGGGNGIALGNLIIGGAPSPSLTPAVVTLAEDLILQGSVKIREESTLNAGGAVSRKIVVRGNWIQGRGWGDSSEAIDGAVTPDFPNGGSGVFEYQDSVVVFEGTRIYISGNTAWYDFICESPGAEIYFSTYFDYTAYGNVPADSALLHTHTVYHLFRVIGSAEGAITVTRQAPKSRNPPEHRLPESGNTIDDPAPTDLSHSNDGGNRGKFWDFNFFPGARMEIDFVNIYYSYASRAIPVPSDDSFTVHASPYYSAQSAYYYNVNWINMDHFFYSFTEDHNGNGKIDAIRAQAAFELASDGDAFDDFEVQVDGYEIDASKGYGGYERAFGDAFSIYIYLKEKDYNDGGKTLQWQIVKNGSLKEAVTGVTRIGRPNEPLTTVDTVPPRIAYSLALPGKNEVYVQISEPVQAAGGAEAAFRLVDNGGVETESLSWNALSQSEFLIGFADNFTIRDLAEGSVQIALYNLVDMSRRAQDMNVVGGADSGPFPPPSYPADWTYSTYRFVPDLETPPDALVPANALVSTAHNDERPEPFATHRLTDLLISAPPANRDDERYFIWPVWARDDSASDNTSHLDSEASVDIFYQSKDADSGLIWDFTGKGILQYRNITVQALRNQALADAPFTAELYYSTDKIIPQNYRAREEHGIRGLWLPPLDGRNANEKDYENREYGNLVPREFNAASSSGIASADNVNLANYLLDKSKYGNASQLEFYFLLRSSGRTPLYAARLDVPRGAETPSDWYRRVKPFSFQIRDTILQRSGVTILNNVINPVKGEKTYINYNLQRAGRVTISVFTLDGTMVAPLVRTSLDAGEYRVSWDGKNQSNRDVARGMYFIRVVGPDIDEIRKVMVVK
ncbi:MAG: hypothetical protein LBG76_09140 [Treponema sp.]|nr:hypothetical protein [Treponema sp.]